MKDIEAELITEVEEEKIEFAKDYLLMKNEELDSYRNLSDKIDSLVVDLEDEYQDLLKMSVDEVYARYADTSENVSISLTFE